jgi:hypothetical protein
MSEEDRSIEAKKEQARLSKHVVSQKSYQNFNNSSSFSVYLIHHH